MREFAKKRSQTLYKFSEIKYNGMVIAALRHQEECMKRKIFALVLVVALVASVAVGLAACNTNDENVVVVGYTLYEPMNYMQDGELIGFDTELAKAVFAELGYKVVFKQIVWSNKYIDLEAGNVNCLWNGFTCNGSDDGIPRSELVDFSYKYMANRQCVVVRADGPLANATLADLNAVAVSGAYEGGSAGESFVDESIPNCTKKSASKQTDALVEVNAGTSQFAVVDLVLAGHTVGRGNFSGLKILDGIGSSDEQYAIGFKKGDPLRDRVNEVLAKFIEDGTTLALAEKYGLTDALITDYSILG